MHHQTIADSHALTIAWAGDALVDWARGGQLVGLAESFPPISPEHLADRGFNRAITSADGQYAFVYQVMGTKGVLLKDGALLREINRSGYQAEAYEYPAAFATLDGITYLVHCPIHYCQLDLENVETGELATNWPGREPNDFFHSRLEVSPGEGYLLSKGWYWHPWDGVLVFDLRAALQNPLLLDGAGWMPGNSTEIGSAGFISETEILLASTLEESMSDDHSAEVLPPGHLVIWRFQTNEFSAAVPVTGPFGNVFPLDARRAWDLYQYPKIIDLATGKILEKLERVPTGQQASSIIHCLPTVPAIVMHPLTKQLAVLNEGRIEVFAAEDEPESH